MKTNYLWLAVLAVVGINLPLSAQSATSPATPARDWSSNAAQSIVATTEATDEEKENPLIIKFNGPLTLNSSTLVNIIADSPTAVPGLTVNGFQQGRIIIYLDGVLLGRDGTNSYDVAYLASLKYAAMQVINGKNGFVELHLWSLQSSSLLSVGISNRSLAPSSTISSIFAEQSLFLDGLYSQNKRFNTGYNFSATLGRNQFSQKGVDYNNPNLFFQGGLSFTGDLDFMRYQVKTRGGYQDFTTTDDMDPDGWGVVKGSAKKRGTADVMMALNDITFGLDHSLADASFTYNFFTYADSSVKTVNLQQNNQIATHSFSSSFSQQFNVANKHRVGYQLSNYVGLYYNNGYNYDDGFSPAVDAHQGLLTTGLVEFNYQYQASDALTIDSYAGLNLSSVGSVAHPIAGATLTYQNQHLMPYVTAFISANNPNLSHLYYASPYYQPNLALSTESYYGGRTGLKSNFSIWSNHVMVELGTVHHAIYGDVDSSYITTYRNSNDWLLNMVASTTGSLDFNPQWAINYGYTFTKALNSSEEYQPFYNRVPQHVSFLGANYRAEKWAVGLGFKYQSPIYANSTLIITDWLIRPYLSASATPIKNLSFNFDATLIAPDNNIIDAYNPSPYFQATFKIGYQL